MKKIVAVILTGAMLLAALAGCAGGTAEAPAAQSPASTDAAQPAPADATPAEDGAAPAEGGAALAGELEIMHYMSGAAKMDVWDAFMQEFQALYPDVEFEMSGTDYANHLTLLRTRAAAGDMPDIFQCTPMKVSDIVEAGKAMDVKAEGLIDQLPLEGDVFGECTWGDDPNAIWGVPYSLKMFSLFYNKDIFDAQGLEAPTTQSEFLAVCQALSDAGIDPMVRGDGDHTHLYVDLKTELVPRLRAAGKADYYAKLMSGEAKFADYPEFVTSVDNLLARHQWESLDDFSNDGSAVAEKLANGEAAMFIGLDSVVMQCFATNPDLNLHSVPYPYSDDMVAEHKNVIELEDGFGIGVDTDMKDAAFAFIKYIFEPAQAQRWHESTGLAMVQPGLDSSKLRPHSRELAESYAGGKTVQNCIPQPVGEFVGEWRSYLQAWIADPNRTTDMLVTEGQAIYDEIIAAGA